jgi:prolyl-tRNA synthetase
MKDGYSFDIDFESAKKSYNLMYETYFRIFKKMGLDAVAVKADTGAIGGDLSHEFHILANTGESQVFYDKKFDDLRKSANVDIEEMQYLYTAADEMHNPETCPIAPEQIASRRGIEVGHIFYFGDKYSKALKATISDKTGKGINPQMGSYGIGVSRLVAAIIESSFDERGIIWPESVAPFQIALINLKVGDENCDKICERIYADLQEKNIEVLYEDSKNGAGQKFANMDLIGIPTQIVIGPKGLANGFAEIRNRKSGEKKEVKIDLVIENLFI